MNQRRVFIHDWEIEVFTGIHPHEKDKKQPLRLNISLYQNDAPAEKIEDVICYSTHRKRMQAVLEAKHYPLLEMIGEALVKAAFEDSKVTRAVIEIEKLGIYEDVEGCGVVFDRTR